MDSILGQLVKLRFIGTIICCVRGYIQVIANDKGEGGELIEDYESNWEFINIMRKLRKRSFIGKISGFENGFLIVSNLKEEMNYNQVKYYGDTIKKFIFQKIDEIETFTFPKIQNFGSNYPSKNGVPFIFYDPTKIARKFEAKVENIGFRLLPYYLNNESSLYRERVNFGTLQGPRNEVPYLTSFIHKLREKFTSFQENPYDYETLNTDLILEKICLFDISNFKFRLLLENIVNFYKTVDFLNNDISVRIANAFCGFNTESLAELRNSLKHSENWTDLSNYFCMTLPFDNHNVIIIGSKKSNDVNVFAITCTEEVIRKVTFAIEIIFEVFRIVFKLTSRNTTINFKILSPHDTSGFFNNLKCLLLVYAFYHDLDMIECMSLSDEDLRLLNYYSKVPEHQIYQTGDSSDDDDNNDDV